MSITVLPPLPPDVAASGQEAIERQMKEFALASATPPRHFDPGRDGFWDAYRYEIDPAFPDLARRIASHRLEQAPPELERSGVAS